MLYPELMDSVVKLFSGTIRVERKLKELQIQVGKSSGSMMDGLRLHDSDESSFFEPFSQQLRIDLYNQNIALAAIVSVSGSGGCTKHTPSETAN